MRIVADTNILVSGLLWRGNPALILDACKTGHVELILSDPIVAELVEVLQRPKPLQRLALAGVSIDEIKTDLLGYALLVVPAQLETGICRDPDDDIILATALAGSVQAVVTGDADLLTIGMFRNIEIISATMMVARL